jgi:hypothetical protein
MHILQANPPMSANQWEKAAIEFNSGAELTKKRSVASLKSK